MDKNYVYSVFAGLGKTTLAKQNDSFIDLESSDFQWIGKSTEKTKEGLKGTDRVFNPKFPENYIQAIKEFLEDGKNVLISAQPKVLDLVEKEKLPLITVYPLNTEKCKRELLQRYADRGNPEPFIKLMESNFENFVTDMESRNDSVEGYYVVGEGLYLSDLKLGMDDKNDFDKL